MSKKAARNKAAVVLNPEGGTEHSVSDEDMQMRVDALSDRRKALEAELKDVAELETKVATAQLLSFLEKCEMSVDALPKDQKFPPEVKKIVRKLNKVVLGKTSSRKTSVDTGMTREEMKAKKDGWMDMFTSNNSRFTIPQLHKAASEEFAYTGSAEQFFKPQLKVLAKKTGKKDEHDSRVFIWEAIAKEVS